ncbi:hypothetical protein [Legionella worsleiensis]|uniref:Uncharacterized protein n=1 Tax=Legionella worsleiensis TaxID=45076 RepID=A0A0W1ALD4_9GAMM|nr:hypothetical protein [Legionella worsleiensis]KTD82094.1 hypothetical protein Lwor_0014 [Legionella worsleiensis]STY31478.1 Uncharacterised protein [Legionella worsleiensis]
MAKHCIGILVLLSFITTQAAVASQLEDQELCVQQTMQACMNQCEKSNDIACSDACQQNADNQCIEAGE